MGSEGFPQFPTEQAEQVTDGSSHRDRGLGEKPDGRARAQDAVDSVPSTELGHGKGSTNHPGWAGEPAGVWEARNAWPSRAPGPPWMGWSSSSFARLKMRSC